MAGRIFQKIDDNLFDQRSVHGNHVKIIRYLYLYRDAGQPLFQPRHSLCHDLLYRLLRLADACRIRVDAGHGEEIFHHMEKPVRVLTDAAYQRFLLFLRKCGSVFQIRGAGTDNGRQRSAQIVGNSPQQIGPHLLLIRFEKKALLLLKLPGLAFQVRRGGAGDNRDA